MLYQEDIRGWLDLRLRQDSVVQGVEVAAGADTCRDYLVHQTGTLADLAAVWKIDVEAYGEANVQFEVLRTWWQLYPRGHYLVKKKGAIIGGFGIWPVTHETYQKIARGELREENIRLNVRRSPRAKEEFWYLSGIAISKRHRRTRALFCLLSNVVAHWCRTQAQKSALRIGSIPVSDQGLRLLVHHGFFLAVDAEHRNDAYPFYERAYTPLDLDELAQRNKRHADRTHI